MKLFVSLLFAASLSAAGPSFFPLDTGNEWTYRHTESGASFTVRVGLPVLIDEKVYYMLSGYAGQRLLVREGPEGSLQYRDEDYARDVLLTSFEPFEGGWFDAPFRPCEQLGQVRERRVPYSGPAGEYQNALMTVYRSIACADAGVIEELYAENIGMMSRVVQSIAGPQRFDLVSARVGKMTLGVEPSGVFSVTVNRPAPADLTATAILRLKMVGRLAVRQPTPQEYDVLLRDSSGRVLWRWSEGRVFPPVIVDTTFEGERAWRVEIPLRILELPLPAESYTVEAWLTTGEERPQFAAAAPLNLGRERESAMIE